MPLVRIDLWPVDRERKNALIKNVTNAVVDSIGCPEGAVEIILNEVEKTDWAIGGVCHAEKFPDRG